MGQTAKRAGLAALLLPGALVVGGLIVVTLAWVAWKLYQATGTGNAKLDRFRWRVSWEVAKAFGTSARPAHARACMVIVEKESGGDPKNYTHDLNAKGGPGVGPMAVNRRTAIDLGLWTPPAGVTADSDEARAAFLALRDDETRGVRMGVRVFKAKLAAANGDVAEALRRYNGSGAMAEAYRDDAVAKATKHYGAGALS